MNFVGPSIWVDLSWHLKVQPCFFSKVDGTCPQLKQLLQLNEALYMLLPPGGPRLCSYQVFRSRCPRFHQHFSKKMLQKKTGKAWPIRETNIIPENGPSQKKFHLPTIDTIDFHAQADSFREGNNQKECEGLQTRLAKLANPRKVGWFPKKKLPDLDGREIRETFDQLNMMKKCPPLIYNRFYTPPKFNITPENRPSQKESPL